MTKTNNTLTWRVQQLEKTVGDLDTSIDTLMTNHLPHINQSLVAFKGEMKNLSTRITLGIGINVIFVIAGIIGIVLLIR